MLIPKLIHQKKVIQVFVLLSMLFSIKNSYAQTYCMPVFTAACTSNDFINNVFTTGGVLNINNLTTGCNGTLPSNTTFFPNQLLSANPNDVITINVQSGAAWGQGFRVWVDWNNDGLFDATESVYASPASNTTVNTGTFTIPSLASPGIVRLRVMCRFAAVPFNTDACATTLTSERLRITIYKY